MNHLRDDPRASIPLRVGDGERKEPQDPTDAAPLATTDGQDIKEGMMVLWKGEWEGLLFMGIVRRLINHMSWAEASALHSTVDVIAVLGMFFRQLGKARAEKRTNTQEMARGAGSGKTKE
jgi:hypothetical protein